MQERKRAAGGAAAECVLHRDPLPLLDSGFGAISGYSGPATPGQRFSFKAKHNPSNLASKVEDLKAKGFKEGLQGFCLQPLRVKIFKSNKHKRAQLG